MAKLSPVSWTDLVKRLRALGFEGPYQEGNRSPYCHSEPFASVILSEAKNLVPLRTGSAKNL